MSHGEVRPDQLNGIESLTRGDEADARELRANLAVFARTVDKPGITNLVADVLSGRRNVREVFRTEEFEDVLGRRFDNVQRALDRLSDDEREQLFDEARERTPQDRLDALRDSYDPNPGAPLERVKPPSEEDEDEFFENFSVFDQ